MDTAEEPEIIRGKGSQEINWFLICSLDKSISKLQLLVLFNRNTAYICGICGLVEKKVTLNCGEKRVFG